MKTTNRYLAAVIALLVVAIVVFMALDLPGRAFSTEAFAAWLAPTPPPGDPIPLQSLEGLNSLNATVKLDVNGLIDGKRTQGDLTGLLASNDQKKSRVTVSGRPRLISTKCPRGPTSLLMGCCPYASNPRP
jgi:hypothetical protein